MAAQGAGGGVSARHERRVEAVSRPGVRLPKLVARVCGQETVVAAQVVSTPVRLRHGRHKMKPSYTRSTGEAQRLSSPRRTVFGCPAPARLWPKERPAKGTARFPVAIASTTLKTRGQRRKQSVGIRSVRRRLISDANSPSAVYLSAGTL